MDAPLPAGARPGSHPESLPRGLGLCSPWRWPSWAPLSLCTVPTSPTFLFPVSGLAPAPAAAAVLAGPGRGGSRFPVVLCHSEQKGIHCNGLRQCVSTLGVEDELSFVVPLRTVLLQRGQLCGACAGRMGDQLVPGPGPARPPLPQGCSPRPARLPAASFPSSSRSPKSQTGTFTQTVRPQS